MTSPAPKIQAPTPIRHGGLVWGAGKANSKGTGLGLYVARQLIEAQNVKIRAESEGEKKGARFTVGSYL